MKQHKDVLFEVSMSAEGAIAFLLVTDLFFSSPKSSVAYRAHLCTLSCCRSGQRRFYHLCV